MAISPNNQDIYERQRRLAAANAAAGQAQKMYSNSGVISANMGQVVQAQTANAMTDPNTAPALAGQTAKVLSNPYIDTISAVSTPKTATNANGGAFDNNTDYSVLIRNAIANNADPSYVQELQDARNAKIAADPSLSQYDKDDYYWLAQNYIDSAPYRSLTMAKTLVSPQRTDDYYEPNYRRVLEEAENFRPFQYDSATDPAYQALAKQYRREGARATQNALANASALTGGLPSSYAVGAATQAGNYYAAQLSDRIPELYQQAYNRYLAEYQRKLGIADYYRQGTNDAEARYQSDVSRYNTDYDRALGAYRDELADAQNKEQTDYARAIYAQEYADQQAAAASQAEYNQYQNELAQANKDREYDLDLQKLNLDTQKYLANYDADQQAQLIKDAINVSDLLGFVPEQYADILGVPAGTSTADRLYKQASLSARSTRRAGDEDDEVAELILDQNSGSYILSDEDWDYLIDQGYSGKWLQDHGFVKSSDIADYDSAIEYMKNRDVAADVRTSLMTKREWNRSKPYTKTYEDYLQYYIEYATSPEE